MKVKPGVVRVARYPSLRFPKCGRRPVLDGFQLVRPGTETDFLGVGKHGFITAFAGFLDQVPAGRLVQQVDGGHINGNGITGRQDTDVRTDRLLQDVETVAFRGELLAEVEVENALSDAFLTAAQYSTRRS